MNNEPEKITPDNLSGYSKEQLELIASFNMTAFQKEMQSAQLEHTEKLNQSMRAQAEAAQKKMDLELEEQRMKLRPHSCYPTQVGYCTSEHKYYCRMATFSYFADEDDDGVEEIPIIAYGDTPAEACDNFDHLWINGEKNPDVQ